jgi:hypothetical protein
VDRALPWMMRETVATPETNPNKL